MNPLPPQAYTREILQKAYQWLLTQNSSIKEMASNQEILVSLYLKAQRNGEASLEAPSIQNFKQELKSLANMIGDFQSESKPSIPAPLTQSTIESSSQNIQPSPNHLTQLDPQSMICIQEVKSILNLSNDTEALRALISLGHKQFKKINN